MSRLENNLSALSNEASSKRPIKLVLANITPPNFSTRFSAVGVETLTGFVRSHLGDACQVKMLDAQVFPSREKMVSEMSSFSPEVVGFSLHPGARQEVDKIITSFKEQGKEPLFLFGNVAATFTAEDLIKNYPRSLVVLGEGEEALVGVLKSLKEGTDLEQIPNLFFRNSQGETVFTRRERMDLKKVGLPAFDNSRTYLEGSFRIGAESSRGCFYDCSFCNRREFLSEGSWRGFSPERTLKVLTELSSIGIPGINFADDDFLQGPREHLVQLAQGIIDLKREGKINPNFQFFFSTRVNEVIAKKDILRKLKEGGLAGVFLGIESGDEEILKSFQKKITLVQTEEAVKILKGLNLIIEAGFIMFDPQMTLEQLENNLKFIRKTGIADSLSYPFSQLRAQPGSQVLARLNEAHLLTGNLDTNWLVYPYKFKDQRIPLVIKTCKEWEIGFYRLADCLKDLYRYHGFTENVNSPLAKAIGRRLETMRELYIDFLGSAVDWVKSNDPNHQSLVDLEKRFSKLRALFIAATLQDIEKGEIKDTFSVFYKEGVLSLLRDESFIENSFLINPASLTSDYQLDQKRVASVLTELYDRGELSRKGEFYLLPSSAGNVFRAHDFVGVDG